MFEEVESNISKIVSHCLHECISNPQRNPSFISNDHIIKYFPDKLNIQRFDITEQFQGAWMIKNAHIDCQFGLKFITNNNKTKSLIMSIINDTTNIHNSQDLYIQPISIHKGFISKQIRFEWAKLEHVNNDWKQSGLKCRFNAMNETHQFGIIPFVKCNQFNFGDGSHHNKGHESNDNHNKQINHDYEPVLCSGCDNDKTYDEWYAEQYLDFYGFHDKAHDKEQETDSVPSHQNDNALQPITLNQQHQHYGAGQNGHNGNHMQRAQEAEGDEDEDIDLNYHRNQMNTSMNNRRERKRIFRHFEDQAHGGYNQLQYNLNPNKKRKFNYCTNNKMSLYQS